MKYIDSSHTYINDDGIEYTPVTKVVKSLEPYKNWDEIAQKFAKKHKRDVEDVKKEWKEEARKGNERGTKYHNEQEAKYVQLGKIEIDGNIYDIIHSPIQDDIKLAIPLQLTDNVYPELLIYSHKYKVAGQADLVEIRGGKIHITDYKTNKKIDLESYKHWKNGHEMLNYPVSHLMSCNFYTYALQINLYMCMLKSHNPELEVGDMKIKHVSISQDIFGEEYKEVLYDVPNLQKEAKTVLEYYANKNI